MDDGYRYNNGQAISTHGYTEKEVQMLITFINDAFSFSSYSSMVDKNRRETQRGSLLVLQVEIG